MKENLSNDDLHESHFILVLLVQAGVVGAAPVLRLELLWTINLVQILIFSVLFVI